MGKHNEQGNNGKMSKVDIIVARLMAALCGVSLWFANGFYSLAAANYGERMGRWFLDQLNWIAIVAVAVGAVFSLVKRAWIAMTVIVIGGGIVIAIINDPNAVAEIGRNIFSVFKG